MSLFWELHQYRMIGEATSAAGRGVSKANEAKRDVTDLEDRLDRLILVNMAMWELLRQCSDLTEEDLTAKVQEIDLRDGRADGKVTKQVKKCDKCGRVMSPKHGRCLYCGATDLTAEAFNATL